MSLRIAIRKRLPPLDLDVRLEVGAETLVLFGPSGAGKTSLLNAVAGLLEPDAGEIEIGGRTVYRNLPGQPYVFRPARERRVGYVFQDYALFPHLTALENVAFPLRRDPARAARALELLDRVGMRPHAGHRPDQLSGGQQQRVALARALATGSGVLLLDEPFAAVDGAIRERLQQDLRALQRELGLAVVVVTHDLDDAFAVGDRLAVLRDGRVVQVGPIAEVFDRPASDSVAEVMGVRNLLRATVAETSPNTRLDWRGTILELDGPDPSLRAGAEVTAYIRPEDVKVVYPDRPLASAVAHNVLDGTVVDVRDGSGYRVLQVLVPNGSTVEVRFPRLSYTPLRLEPGEPIRIALRRAGLAVLKG